MYAYAIAWEWLSAAVRWVHIITGIAWIGSSFYFIAMDLGLRRHEGLSDGVHGEEWQVHGGGFYHIQKYMVAPAKMPDHLTWFKWEAYSTWLSGFAMLCIVYYAGAQLYLIDKDVLDVSPSLGIAISLASLAIGWIAYDSICKSALGKNATGLMLLLFVILVAMSWGYTQLFTGRAALLHLGAFTGTIMSANVFFIIMPNQRKVVADLIAGNRPNPALGLQAKQRSTHNNYLTLPVLFLMISNHYPLAFATQYNWLIAALIFLMGVSIRHYFNSIHARAGNPLWTWLVTAALFIAIILLSTFPGTAPAQSKNSIMSLREKQFANAASFDAVRDIVLSRCAMCHGDDPAWDGIITAPKNVKLDSDLQIARRARQIYLHAGRSTAMPPANVTFIEASERAMIVRWYNSVIKLKQRASPNSSS